MATAATLSIDLLVKTQNLVAGFAKAQQEAQSFASKFKAGLGIGAGMGAFNAITSQVESFVGKIRDKLDTLNDVGEISEKIGIGVEALQGLQIAAKHFDVEKGMLEKGLRAISNTVGMAAAGSEVAAEKLAAFGLSAQQLRNLPLEEMAEKIADAMKNMAPGDRLIAATQLFGAKTTDLIKVFDKGSESIKAFIEQGKATGQIASPEQIAAAQQLHAQFKKLGDLWDSMVTQISTALAPGISDLIDAFLSFWETIRPLRDFIGGVFVAAFNGLAAAVKFCAYGMEEAIAKIQQIATDFLNFIGLASDEEYRAATAKFEAAYKKFNDFINGREKKPAVEKQGRERYENTDTVLGPAVLHQIFAPALIRGSVEAYSEMVKLQFNKEDGDVQKQILAEQKQTNKLLKERNRLRVLEADF